jgi:hypothetical protein
MEEVDDRERGWWDPPYAVIRPEPSGRAVSVADAIEDAPFEDIGGHGAGREPSGAHQLAGGSESRCKSSS